MRCLNGLEADAAEVRPAVIVADDEQDVGPVGGETRANDDHAGDRQQKTQISNSCHLELAHFRCGFRYYACRLQSFTSTFGLKPLTIDGSQLTIVICTCTTTIAIRIRRSTRRRRSRSASRPIPGAHFLEL